MGGVLRDARYTPLGEDLVCVVEEFLFSRNRSRGKERQLERCLLEDDFDGVVHLFETFVGSVPYVGTAFERRVFRSAQSVRAVTLLLSFGEPSFFTLEPVVMCWAIEGRSELLRVLCANLEIPRPLLGRAKCELGLSQREDWPSPETYLDMFDDPSYWDFLDLNYLHKKSKQTLLRGRRECSKILIEYEESRVGTTWMIYPVSTTPVDNLSVVFP